MSKMLSALKRLEEKAAIAGGAPAPAAVPAPQQPVAPVVVASVVASTPAAVPLRIAEAPAAIASTSPPAIKTSTVSRPLQFPNTSAPSQPPTPSGTTAASDGSPLPVERRQAPTPPWPGATPGPAIPGRGLSEVPSLSVPLAPATLPMPGVKLAPREPLPARRASDRYVVAPHYAALCERILARLHQGRPAAIWLIPTTLDTDASSVVAELALSLASTADDTVLAIDCDGPRTAIDETTEPGIGVADILGERIDWQKTVNPTRDRRVQLIGTGRRAGLAALTSANAVRLAPLMAEMKTRYRFLVVHGGATIATGGVKAQPSGGPASQQRQKTSVLAQSLVRAADLTYLVLPLHQTSNRQARSAKRRLEQLGGVVHGTILTGAAPAEPLATAGRTGS